MATQKWNKKEILIKYNLSTLQEIQEQTKVYCKSDLDSLFTDLLELFQRNRKRYVYIIKLVSQELRPKPHRERTAWPPHRSHPRPR